MCAGGTGLLARPLSRDRFRSRVGSLFFTSVAAGPSGGFTLPAESAPLTKQWLLNLFESHLPSAPDATWQLYASFWQMAAHHEAYAALAEQMTAAWQALVEEIIRDGVTDGTLRCADIPRTARQISAMLNGYADLLTINPSEIKASEGMADLTQFIDHVLS
ncbi:TetR family transcriptional regulator C-terminal domain-containing protein [Pantoea agglomerans]|uniref:TetR family transcriptional regulator C-terminal domain-containing protein n=1 Tax=Enterobacter agglomerans TaxID=549 RepID=UPI003C7C2FC4